MNIPQELATPINDWVDQHVKHSTENRMKDRCDIPQDLLNLFTDPGHSEARGDGELDPYGEVLGFMFINYPNKILAKYNFPHEQIEQITQLVRTHYNIPEGLPQEGLLAGTMLSISFNDHVVHEHRDPSDDHNHHVRFNCMLKKPPIGGDPVMNDITYEIPELGVWVCEASNVSHKTTATGGEHYRCMLSIGFMLTDSQLLQVRDVIDHERSPKCYTNTRDHLTGFDDLMCPPLMTQHEENQLRQAIWNRTSVVEHVAEINTWEAIINQHESRKPRTSRYYKTGARLR